VTELRAAFVMEESLGHVTHFQNLRTAVSRQVDVVPTWVPIPFKTAGLERWVPGYRTNWSIRASIRARRCLSQELARREHHALFFHTQVTSLFSSRLMRRVPSIISLDATPLNYDSMGAAYGHRPATDSWIDARKHDLNRQAFHAAAAMVTWSGWGGPPGAPGRTGDGYPARCVAELSADRRGAPDRVRSERSAGPAPIRWR